MTRARVLQILTRPGGNRIGMTELTKAIGAPRGARREVQRLCSEFVREGLVERRDEKSDKGKPRAVFMRPAGTGRASLQASGVNLRPVLSGAIKRPKKKGFWASLFERAAQIKAEREQQKEHARRGGP